MLERRDLSDDDDDPLPAQATRRPSRLPIVAVALATVAAAALTVAVVRRAARAPIAEVTSPPAAAPGAPAPPAQPAPNPRADRAVVAMFGAVCRHEVACGIGNLSRCDYIETTMKAMPDEFEIKPCRDFDEAAANRCLDELAGRSCADFAKSLHITDLKAALNRIESCRRACR